MKPRNTLCLKIWRTLSWSAYEHGALIYLSLKTNKQIKSLHLIPCTVELESFSLTISYSGFHGKLEVRFTESNEIIKSAFGLTVLLALNK